VKLKIKKLTFLFIEIYSNKKSKLLNFMKEYLFIAFSLILYLNVLSQNTNDKKSLLEQIKKVKDSSKADLLNELAGIYFVTGKKDSAEYYLNESIIFAERSNNLKGICSGYANMASIAFYDRNFEKAILLYKKSLEIAEKNDFKVQIGNNLANIGRILNAEGKDEDAIEYFARAITFSEKSKDTVAVIYDYSSMGNSYSALNNSAKALDYFNKTIALINLYEANNSLSEFNSQSLSNIKITTNLNLTDIFTNEKKYNDVLKIINNMPDINTISDTVQLLRIYKKKAEAYLGLKNYEKSIENTRLAAKIINEDKKNHIDTYKDIYQIQSEAFAELGQYEHAYKAHVLFKEAADSFFTEEKTKIINEIQTQYETGKKDIEITQLNKEKRSQKLIIALASGSTLIALGLLAFANRSKRLQSKLFKQKQELERNSLEKKMAALEQMALLAQMNPHFIFNSLTSIQNYVYEKDGKAAELFINRFSRLIRQTLENSGKQLITLDEEIKYLDNYLAVEQMRLKNKFQYKINVDENIDKEDISLPGMILQPFVENSIKHGIQHRPSQDGYIHIKISRNGMLSCVVEDNGIGRKNSLLLKSEAGDGYELRGMDITQNRIETINKIYAVNIILTTEDLTNKKGDPEGTRVKIDFPIDQF
jgi:LytS/YehU family sensor histidine kinase